MQKEQDFWAPFATCVVPARPLANETGGLCKKMCLLRNRTHIGFLDMFKLQKLSKISTKMCPVPKGVNASGTGHSFLHNQELVSSKKHSMPRV